MSPSALLRPQRLLLEARRGVDRAFIRFTERFAAVVATAPPERLEQVMGTPAGRVVLEAIFWQMPRQLDRRRARTAEASARWRITSIPGEDGPGTVYDLWVREGRASITRGGGTHEPPVTITVNRRAFLQIATGNLDPMRAYFKGELAISGDIMSAAKLVSLFRIPRASARS